MRTCKNKAFRGVKSTERDTLDEQIGLESYHQSQHQRSLQTNTAFEPLSAEKHIPSPQELSRRQEPHENSHCYPDVCLEQEGKGDRI